MSHFTYVCAYSQPHRHIAVSAYESTDIGQLTGLVELVTVDPQAKFTGAVKTRRRGKLWLLISLTPLSALAGFLIKLTKGSNCDRADYCRSSMSRKKRILHYKTLPGVSSL